MKDFWKNISESCLQQGDLLQNCYVPMFHPDFGNGSDEAKEEIPDDVEVKIYNLIVITQSCDIENDKAPLVALSPYYSIQEFQEINPDFQKKGAWENVRKGRVEGLHMLASPDTPNGNRHALVVNFREVYSLPVGYLVSHAKQSGDRWRLNSPFLEHFSQSFARFFMRVGLPSAIPPFK